MKKLDTSIMLQEFLAKGNRIKRLPATGFTNLFIDPAKTEQKHNAGEFGAYRFTAAQRKANRIARKKGLT